MKTTTQDKFRQALAKKLELWDLTQDLEIMLQEEAGVNECIDGIDDTLDAVAAGCDGVEDAKAISAEAIDDVLADLLPDKDDKKGGAQ